MSHELDSDYLAGLPIDATLHFILHCTLTGSITMFFFLFLFFLQ